MDVELGLDVALAGGVYVFEDVRLWRIESRLELIKAVAEKISDSVGKSSKSQGKH